MELSSASQDIVVSGFLDRLKLCAQRPTDNEDQIKSITSKLLAKIKTQEKLTKEFPAKSAVGQHVWIFLSILSNTSNIFTVGNIILIFQELVENKPTRRATLASILSNDGVQTLFRTLPVVMRDSFCPETILPAFFFVLIKVARKDSKFPVTTRSCGGLKSMLSIMKSNTRNSVLLRHLMEVMRICVVNSTNCAIVGKDGIVSTLLNVINSLGRKPTFLMKLTLETLGHVSKCKSNIQRIVKHNGVPRLLRVLEQWDKYDGDNKRKICRANLIVLGHIAESKCGQRAISESGGINVLFKFCMALPQTSDFDNVLQLASAVVQKCLPQKQLPIDSTYGPYCFSLPSTAKELPATLNLRAVRNTDSSPGSPGDDEEEDDEDVEDDEASDSNDSNKECQASGEVIQERASTMRKCCSPASSMSSSSSDGTDACFATSPLLSQEELNHYAQFFDELTTDVLDTDVHLANSATTQLSVLNSIGNNSSSLMDDSGYQASSLSFFENRRRLDREQIYKEMSEKTKHVAMFVKLAYPEMQSGEIYEELEPLNDKDPNVCRSRLLENLNRSMNPPKFTSRIVYDLDSAVKLPVDNPYGMLDNDDEDRVGKHDNTTTSLKFESRFESGNLRKAIQISCYDYELILNPDINSTTHYQWFYFEVSNMDAVFPYTFHIINCEKQNSQFNFGMKPVIYSVKEAMLGRPGWVRSGSDICYYRNVYQRDASDETVAKCFYTTTFSVTFKHANDVCYIAYHYPYTFTLLQTDIVAWERTINPEVVYFKSQEVCKSMGENGMPVLTITSMNPIGRENRKYIFLTGRVHPGESNSSWVMKGTIDFLLSNKTAAKSLRDMFIFKIVPMLNPDGVINGCHRCDLAAEDLNRCWLQPCPILQPTIYHTKALLLYMQSISKIPLVFCDYHGHSRKKNIFLYGCSRSQSWHEGDRNKPDDREYELIPQLLHHMAPAFALESCEFVVEKVRESTARVTVWRQIGVARSYTMESSYCGCDEGSYKGMHLGIKHLQEMGQRFGQAMVHVRSDRTYPPTSIFLFPEESSQSSSRFPSRSSDERKSAASKPSSEEYEDVTNLTKGSASIVVH